MLLFILLASIELSQSETVHWQWRDLICKTEGNEGDKITEMPSTCLLALCETEHDQNKRFGPTDAGCFDEQINGTVRSYCDIGCPGADTVYLIKRDPQVHRSCFVFYTHKLERRENNWYLWREKRCRHSQVTFTIRCEFLFSRKEFPNDTIIFEKLKG